MKRFKIVFNFEFRSLAFKKSIIVSSLIVAIVVFGLTFIPRFVPSFMGSTDETNDESIQYRLDPSSGLMFAQEEDFEVFSPYVGYARIFDNEESLKAAVMDQEIESGVFFRSLTDYTVYRYDTSIVNMGDSYLDSIIQSINFNIYLQEHDIDPNIVNDALNIQINRDVVVLGTDGSQGVGFVYLYIFAIYFVILLYGVNVSTSVAREKDSRTMELLITSTKPRVLMLGKVFAAGLVGALQLAILIVAVVLGLYINKAYIPDFIFMLIGGNLAIDTITVFILFALTGYTLYLFIYAALGSLVSKVEDVSSAVQPITFVFIIAYFTAMMAFSMPDAGFVRISSYIPFTAIFTMPIRFMLTTVSVVELIVSLLIMGGTTALIAMISVYIYRFGSLNYGNKLKLKEIVAAWRRGE